MFANTIALLLIGSLGWSRFTSAANIPRAGQPVCETKWFTQTFDHSNPSNKENFQQRYIVCRGDWLPGGPLLFFTGSEADLMVFFNNTGFIFELAAELHGLVVFAEHRYYGQSMPSSFDVSLRTNTPMAGLTVDNALADFKVLIDFLKRNITGLETAAVVTLGGSYGGMLSAWMRMRYPDVVTGALASSAPLLEVGSSVPVPCNAELKQTTEIYRSVSPVCSDAIRRSWNAMRKVFSEPDGGKWLQETFRTCSPIADRLELDDDFMPWLHAAWYYMAMCNYPFPSNFFHPLPEFPVKAACSHLNSTTSNTTDRELLRGIAKAALIYYNHTGQVATCNHATYTSTSSPNWPGRQWRYQACRELFMPDCANGIDDMFYVNEFKPAEIFARCNAWTGFTYDPTSFLRRFGGDDLRDHTNIIFSNGKLDPCLPGCIGAAHQKEGITTILIDDGAHHLDLQASHHNDPPSVTEARRQEIRVIRGWIKDRSNGSDLSLGSST